jgi:hypothetical protein
MRWIFNFATHPSREARSWSSERGGEPSQRSSWAQGSDSDSVNLGSNPGPPASYALTTILFLGGWLSPVPFSPFTAAPGAV